MTANKKPIQKKQKTHKPTSKNRKNLGLIILVIIILVGVGALVYSRHNANKDKINIDLNLKNDPSQAYGDPAIQAEGRDVERKVDINALQGSIEDYLSKTGYYPTLIDINNSAWRTANVSINSTDMFKDPDGTSDQLAAQPAAHVYAYQPTPVGCRNPESNSHCTGYVLTATLEAGGIYSKQNLN